jgi:Fur family ferric uptake transcriptional regulator
MVYHVVNKGDNSVEALDAETSAQLRAALSKVEELLKSRGYAEVSHMVEFFGVTGKSAQNRPASGLVVP